jgi:hypothetical protein
MEKLKIPPITAYLKQFTTNLNLLLIMIAILVTLWISLVIIGVYSLGLNNNWAGLTIDQWLYVGIGLISLFIIITIILNFLPIITMKLKAPKEKRKPTFYHGKRVHEFTFPIESKGGVYSRTYINIDDKNLVNFRYQMIHPEDLWKPKI